MSRTADLSYAERFIVEKTAGGYRAVRRTAAGEVAALSLEYPDEIEARRELVLLRTAGALSGADPGPEKESVGLAGDLPEGGAAVGIAAVNLPGLVVVTEAGEELPIHISVSQDRGLPSLSQDEVCVVMAGPTQSGHYVIVQSLPLATAH